MEGYDYPAWIYILGYSYGILLFFLWITFPLWFGHWENWLNNLDKKVKKKT